MAILLRADDGARLAIDIVTDARLPGVMSRQLERALGGAWEFVALGGLDADQCLAVRADGVGLFNAAADRLAARPIYGDAVLFQIEELER